MLKAKPDRGNIIIRNLEEFRKFDNGMILSRKYIYSSIYFYKRNKFYNKGNQCGFLIFLN